MSESAAASRVVVLGGGPAGDVAALRAAQLGAQTTLIERDRLGGTCLNWGCIPTKSLLAGADLLRKLQHAGDFGIEVETPRVNFARMMARKEEIVDRLRRGVEAACKRRSITVVHAPGRVDGDSVVTELGSFEYDDLIVCVGTEPSGLPGIDMDHPRVLTSNGILRIGQVPERLLVIGGGVVGCEFASLFATLGSRVTVVEVLPQILSGVDSEIVAVFQKEAEHQGVAFHTGTRASDFAYTKRSVSATINGADHEFDFVLVSVGRAAQTSDIGLEEAGVTLDKAGHIEVDSHLRTGNPKIWAAGDCIGGQQLAHLASAEGARAVENALGYFPGPMDRTVVPSCVYTYPEIASVGLSPESAIAAGHDLEIGQARLLGNGKVLAEGESMGMARIYSDAGTGMILGASMVGIHAVELIGEIAVAISDGLTTGDLGSVIHPHPTVSEVWMDAAQQAEGTAPYLS